MPAPAGRCILKYMHRKLLCGLVTVWCASAPVLVAQSVPARDLWDFPIGAIGEPAALASEAGVGLWNPAAMALPPSMRWRAGVASLSTGVEQSVEGQLLGVAVRRPNGRSLGLSVARSAVTGIVRTDTDPQALGEVPYQSLLVSLTTAQRVLPHVTAGVAARWRQGRADQDVRSALAADVGIIVDELPLLDARVALGTFLWRPGREVEDRPLVTAATDVRVAGHSSKEEIRLGMAAQGTTRGVQDRTVQEIGPFGSARFGPLEARAALPTVRGTGERVTRARFAIALHYARFVVGVGREDSSVGLGPLYQITLSSFGQ